MLQKLFYNMLYRISDFNPGIFISGIKKAGLKGILYTILMLLPIITFPLCAISQQLNYKVLRNGNEIGWMKLEKSCEGNYCRMILHSAIKFRAIILMTANIFESAYFLNERLVFSSQYHKSNGNVSVNKQTKFTGNGYEVFEGNKRNKLDLGIITFNLLCLYFREPQALKKVYCDKQQSYANIERTSDGGYKIKFENGNSNIFYYKMGVCTKVKIDHPLYTAEVILNQ